MGMTKDSASEVEADTAMKELLIAVCDSRQNKDFVYLY